MVMVMVDRVNGRRELLRVVGGSLGGFVCA